MCSNFYKFAFYAILLASLSLYCFADSEDEDFYKLLEVPRDATVKEIRKAFKKLAVKYHPDKNMDDKDADAKFVKLAKAYEILKEPETRKRYDLYGDTGDSKGKQQYHSYSYYKNDFGIYDDDELIVTLSRADYEVNIVDSNQAWFVNFYSPQCHHCHTLAPVWRKLSRELEGVVRIAAVNCEEDWTLCNHLGIRAYPTLLYYEKDAHMFDGDPYEGDKTFYDLQDFVLSKLTVNIQNVDNEVWDYGFDRQQWLLFLCPLEGENCPEKDTRLKIAATIEGLMQVGIVTDKELCDKIYESHKDTPVVFWQVDEEAKDVNVPNKKALGVKGSDFKEIVENILDLLPNPKMLDEENFKDVRTQLRLGSDKPWLICFYLGHATELNIRLKRLPTLVSNVNIGLVHCGKSASLCSSLHVSHYPTWGILKPGGAFEIHHGRDILNDVAAFARDGSKSTNLHALSPADFEKIKREGELWFIDWYAPWCPPCRKLMPEIRKASQQFDSEKIQFGTIDCTLHTKLCHNAGIQSYPTTAVYNGSSVTYFHGTPNENTIVEFLENFLDPKVITLDEDNFIQLLRKPADELWVVDFYAPWCGACQVLSPHWRKLGKQMADFKNIKIAQVDCVANVEICNSQNIRAYPTIRLYPLGSKGLRTVALYNGQYDATALKKWIVGFLPTPVEPLTDQEFRKQILTKRFMIPWVVDFYAPWCGHCTHFEPEYIVAAQKLEGKVRTGKIDCERFRHFCAQMGVNSYPTVRIFFSPDEYVTIESYESKELTRRVKQLIADRKNKEHDEL